MGLRFVEEDKGLFLNGFDQSRDRQKNDFVARTQVFENPPSVRLHLIEFDTGLSERRYFRVSENRIRLKHFQGSLPPRNLRALSANQHTADEIADWFAAADTI